MVRMLVADDEAGEREIIRYLVGKYQIPAEIDEAVNGKDALRRLTEGHYDILLTDVRMPFMDGLALANRARDLNPEIFLIFFSGYDDFSYIKQALSLKASNYILKPIDPAEFKNTVMDVLDQIRQEEQLRREKAAAQNYLLNHLIYMLIYQRLTPQQINVLYPELDFTAINGFNRLFLIQSDAAVSAGRSRDAGVDAFHDAIRSVVSGDVCVINLNTEEDILLFPGEARPLLWYRDLADRIIARVKESCGVSCRIAISGEIKSPEEIGGAFRAVEKELAERFLYEDSSAAAPLKYSDLSAEDGERLKRQIEDDIRFGDPEGLRQHIGVLLEFYRRSDMSHIYMITQCVNLLKNILDALPDTEDRQFDEYADAVYHAASFSEIKVIILRLSGRLASFLESHEESPGSLADRAKSYIHSHYADDLSLSLIAENVNLTPHYLSALFIKETGIGINRYIKKVRMDKARELLLGTSLKVEEIGIRTGYTNVSYFSRSFADEFGYTPSAFRSAHAVRS